MVRLSISLCLLMVLVAGPRAAEAQDVEAPAADAEPTQALAAIREMALYARYREALDAVAVYLGRTDLDAAQRNAGLEVLATLHIAMRDQDAAREALTQLYARDPQHRLSDPDASPPVLSAFGRARSSPPEPIAVTIEHEPPTLERRAPLSIGVRLAGEGADAVAEVQLFYRQGDDTGYTTVVLRRGADGSTSTRLPLLERSEAYDVSYYVEGQAPSGAVLATRGTAAEPLTLRVPEAQAEVVTAAPSETASGGEDLWWVGLIVAVLVVGGGVTAGILLYDELEGPQDGSLGTLELPLVRF